MSNTTNLTIALSEKPHSYPIQIGNGILSQLGEFTTNCLPKKAQRAIVVSNQKVLKLYGETAQASLTNAGFQASTFSMPDGERYKNFRVLEKALEFFSEQKLTRNDVIIALGGGVVGDLAGFAAAVFQRGIAFIQVPTTFLAQIDSSVGGKTAVNTVFGKNLIGAFHQPHGVLIDTNTLRTLPHRELVAGFFEAVKQGAIGDKQLFEETTQFVKTFPLKQWNQIWDLQTDKRRRVRPQKVGNADKFYQDLQNLIAANINFKAAIVMGDEREDTSRDDARSRRILNFGHTVGHALEKITNYKRFKHGEAVGIGMLVAANLSKRLGRISQNELNLFYDVVRSVGKLPKTDDISFEAVLAAFSHDKKSIGDSFKWILLDGIGRAAIVDSKNIPEEIVHEALRLTLHN